MHFFEQIDCNFQISKVLKVYEICYYWSNVYIFVVFLILIFHYVNLSDDYLSFINDVKVYDIKYLVYI